MKRKRRPSKPPMTEQEKIYLTHVLDRPESALISLKQAHAPLRLTNDERKYKLSSARHRRVPSALIKEKVKENKQKPALYGHTRK